MSGADEATGGTEPEREEPRCPVCGRPRAPRYRPFCSKHCADVDLGRWLSGAYVIAGEPADPDETGEG